MASKGHKANVRSDVSIPPAKLPGPVKENILGESHHHVMRRHQPVTMEDSSLKAQPLGCTLSLQASKDARYQEGITTCLRTGCCQGKWRREGWGAPPHQVFLDEAYLDVSDSPGQNSIHQSLSLCNILTRYGSQVTQRRLRLHARTCLLLQNCKPYLICLYPWNLTQRPPEQALATVVKMSR